MFVVVTCKPVGVVIASRSYHTCLEKVSAYTVQFQLASLAKQLCPNHGPHAAQLKVCAVQLRFSLQ